VQTYRPENAVLVKATGGRLREFYEGELKTRKLLDFPPFSRLIRVVVRGRNRERVVSVADNIRSICEKKISGAVELLGPVECPFSRIAGNWRFHMIFRGPSFAEVHRSVRSLYEHYVPPRGVYLEFDVDPLSLL
jgi:primosomal protein N' (replication factor Y)